MGALKVRRAAAVLATGTLLALFSWPAFAAPNGRSKLDRALTSRAGTAGTSRVIVRAAGGDVESRVRVHRGRSRARLNLVGGYLADVPNDALAALAADPAVASVHLDRPVTPLLAEAGAGDLAPTPSPWSSSVFDGGGVGVAVIDSGITRWHDDLARVQQGRAVVGQRVVGFADFTRTTQGVADGYGHGTHVAGIVAGSGYDADGAYAGVAPGAHLLVLKVLDAEGRGYVSDVIRAIEFAVTNRDRYNLRVLNLSIGAPVFESYETDPLTLAALQAVRSGLVVVAAAGNLGKNGDGEQQYGGITAPGNAPWVLTVGAYSHMGTPDPSDDRVAGYSSRGPTAVDFSAKPDIVAPGTRIVSLNDQGSTLSAHVPHELVPGSRGSAYPYITLSGTSMAAPVVSGVVARMLQANPGLTPNAVKAILQYTATFDPSVDVLAQGAGFLNAGGAVALSRFYAAGREGHVFLVPESWSTHIIWGNRRITGGTPQPWGSAWSTNVIWGSTADNVIWGSACTTPDCDNVIWGSSLESVVNAFYKDNVIWGSACQGDDCDNVIWGSRKDNVIWGSADGDNVIWGSACQGRDCDNVIWGSHKDNVIWGSADGDNVIWGSACTGPDCDNVIWGSTNDNVIWGSDAGNVVWGAACGGRDCDNVIWGSTEDNVIWGSACAGRDCDNVIWGSADGDNVIWGSADGDNVIWGSADGDNVIWGSACTGPDCDNVIWGSTFGVVGSLAGEPGGVEPALGAGAAALRR